MVGVVGAHGIPVHEVPPRRYELVSAALVLQVVGVLPYITGEDGDSVQVASHVHEWVVVVGSVVDC